MQGELLPALVFRIVPEEIALRIRLAFRIGVRVREAGEQRFAPCRVRPAVFGGEEVDLAHLFGGGVKVPRFSRRINAVRIGGENFVYILSVGVEHIVPFGVRLAGIERLVFVLFGGLPARGLRRGDHRTVLAEHIQRRGRVLADIIVDFSVRQLFIGGEDRGRNFPVRIISDKVIYGGIFAVRIDVEIFAAVFGRERVRQLFQLPDLRRFVRPEGKGARGVIFVHVVGEHLLHGQRFQIFCEGLERGAAQAAEQSVAVADLDHVAECNVVDLRRDLADGNVCERLQDLRVGAAFGGVDAEHVAEGEAVQLVGVADVVHRPAGDRFEQRVRVVAHVHHVADGQPVERTGKVFDRPAVFFGIHDGAVLLHLHVAAVGEHEQQAGRTAVHADHFVDVYGTERGVHGVGEIGEGRVSDRVEDGVVRGDVEELPQRIQRHRVRVQEGGERVHRVHDGQPRHAVGIHIEGGLFARGGSVRRRIIVIEDVQRLSGKGGVYGKAAVFRVHRGTAVFVEDVGGNIEPAVRFEEVFALRPFGAVAHLRVQRGIAVGQRDRKDGDAFARRGQLHGGIAVGSFFRDRRAHIQRLVFFGGEGAGIRLAPFSLRRLFRRGDHDVVVFGKGRIVDGRAVAGLRPDIQPRAV